MDKEYIRRKKIADLSQEFFDITNGLFEIIRYKENRDKDNKDLLLASIPLKEHPVYGETKVHVLEMYDENRDVQYHYGWEKTKGSKQTKHISAWGNEPHPVGHRRVNTEPFHHHHIPENPAERKDCHHIHSLKDVLEFVQEIIKYQKEYNEEMNT